MNLDNVLFNVSEAGYPHVAQAAVSLQVNAQLWLSKKALPSMLSVAKKGTINQRHILLHSSCCVIRANSRCRQLVVRKLGING